MNKYNNPRLTNTTVAGSGLKHPTRPHVILGDASNKFIPGDLMDANAVIESIGSSVDEKIDKIVDGAPEALDTLKELSAALNNDADFATTVVNKLNDINAFEGIVDKDSTPNDHKYTVTKYALDSMYLKKTDGIKMCRTYKYNHDITNMNVIDDFDSLNYGSDVVDFGIALVQANAANVSLLTAGGLYFGPSELSLKLHVSKYNVSGYTSRKFAQYTDYGIALADTATDIDSKNNGIFIDLTGIKMMDGGDAVVDLPSTESKIGQINCHMEFNGDVTFRSHNFQAKNIVADDVDSLNLNVDEKITAGEVQIKNDISTGEEYINVLDEIRKLQQAVTSLAEIVAQMKDAQETPTE